MSTDDREKDEESASGAASASRPGADLARARPNITGYERMDAALDLLASGKVPREAARLLCKEHDMSLRTAQRYVAAALYRLTSDDNVEPIESKRARHKAMLRRRIERAENLKRTGVTNGQTYEYDSPDLNAANAAHGMLMAVEGVIPPKAAG